jgi:hypothetical protein
MNGHEPFGEPLDTDGVQDMNGISDDSLGARPIHPSGGVVGLFQY